MTIMLKISNSEIQCFKQCRRRWYLNYYLELAKPITDPTGAAPLGTNVHQALELYYSSNADPVITIDSIYHSVMSEWSAEEYPHLSKSIINEHQLARLMVEGYTQWLEDTGIDSGIEFIDTEKVLEIPTIIAGQEVILRGKLDARVRRLSDNKILFLDHKTVQNFSDHEKLLHMNQQMLFYHILEKLHAKNQLKSDSYQAGGALYNMLRKVKRTARAMPPFYKRVEVIHNDNQMRSAWYHIHETINDILKLRKRLDACGNEDQQHMIIYPSPSRDCGWICPFADVCGMIDDGSHYKDFIKNEYIHLDPHERYNLTK